MLLTNSVEWHRHNQICLFTVSLPVCVQIRTNWLVHVNFGKTQKFLHKKLFIGIGLNNGQFSLWQVRTWSFHFFFFSLLLMQNGFLLNFAKIFSYQKAILLFNIISFNVKMVEKPNSISQTHTHSETDEFCNVVQMCILWQITSCNCYGRNQTKPIKSQYAVDSFRQKTQKRSIKLRNARMLALIKEYSIFHYKCKHGRWCWTAGGDGGVVVRAFTHLSPTFFCSTSIHSYTHTHIWTHKRNHLHPYKQTQHPATVPLFIYPYISWNVNMRFTSLSNRIISINFSYSIGNQLRERSKERKKEKLKKGKKLLIRNSNK